MRDNVMSVFFFWGGWGIWVTSLNMIVFSSIYFPVQFMNSFFLIAECYSVIYAKIHTDTII